MLGYAPIAPGTVMTYTEDCRSVRISRRIDDWVIIEIGYFEGDPGELDWGKAEVAWIPIDTFNAMARVVNYGYVE